VVVCEDAVESRSFSGIGGRERIVRIISKRREENAELHAPAKATSDAPIAPERGPNIDGVTVMVGRVS
jgi:hypothetical protein